MNIDDFILMLKDYYLLEIKFERGLGIISSMFILSFTDNRSMIQMEVDTNFRIRNSKKVLLAFNDLYLDKKRNEISTRTFRSQSGIEKTYLSVMLDETNRRLKNSKIYNISLKQYGDILIRFKNGIVMEILNDVHLEEFELYRIIYKGQDKEEVYVCRIKNNEPVFMKKVGD